MKRTHQTAVVWIPDGEIQPPIQAIRSRHDRKVSRWMPHITLLYPFVPESDFLPWLPLLEQACREIRSFPVSFSEIRWFRHRRECTLWLSPEPAAPWVDLYDRLCGVMENAGYSQMNAQRFTPHLSVGQAPYPPHSMQDALQAGWQPLATTVSSIALIARNEPPDDRFRVVHRVALSGDSG